MKRALIGGLSALAMIVGVEAANAQANINPNVYPGNTSEQYGARAPWEWYASVGPVRRGRQCVVDVDSAGAGCGRASATTDRSSLPSKEQQLNCPGELSWGVFW
jgi:hypothetical protein